MKFFLLSLVLMIALCIADGRSYGYGRRKKFIKSKKPIVKPLGFATKMKIPAIDRCPPVACTKEFIPFECRKKRYFFMNGVKCQGCDVNICRGKNEPFDIKLKHKKTETFMKDNHKSIPTKSKKVPKKHLPIQLPKKLPVGGGGPMPDLPIGPLSPIDNRPLDLQNPVPPVLLPGGPIGVPNPDPVTVVNSPPSDNEFVNRVRFDQNNMNLLQPPAELPPTTSFADGVSAVQPPFQQNIQSQFQTGSNAFIPPGTAGMMNPDIQSLNENIARLMWQNQMLTAQLQQQAAQFQSQQSWNQFPGQQPPISSNMLPNAQGIPSWTPNPNMIPGFQTGGGIPPFTGTNTNVQGQMTPSANSWAAAQGFNIGQNSLPVQNTQPLSLIDPLTNQPLQGGSNSLHGPLNP